MSKPLAVVVGFIGKFPVAGMSLYNIHYIAGLQDLGYEVHYVERQNRPDECYDPIADAFTDDPSFAFDYLDSLLPHFGVGGGRWSFIDRENRCHGAPWSALREALDRAELVLNIADPTWFDELERCPRRAFVDGDPLFTQVDMAQGNGLGGVLTHYGALFTYCVRMGLPDCTVPFAGRCWMPTCPVVCTRFWDSTPACGPLPVTVLMNWRAWGEVTYEGRVYGHKNRELERFLDLPRRARRPVVLAVGGEPPRRRLRKHGWLLVDPLKATRTIDGYQDFIRNSHADLGIAKHAYVASRCGWFSDRSTCYLAAGRPVLHQDTGFGEWLPTGEGVLAFSEMEDLLEALERLDRDYLRHARAARRIAEEHFEASRVVARMLAEAGFD